MTIDVTTPADTESIRTGASRIREAKQNIIDGLAALIPSGSIIDYAGPTAPTGWLLCDGSSVLRATYPDLFTAIGIAFGSIDGTHFTLPDARGRASIGAGAGSGLTARTLADVGGEETHLLTSAEMPTHNHTIVDTGHSHSVTGQTQGLAVAAGANGPFLQVDAGTYGTTTVVTNIAINNAGSGNVHNNMQPFIAFNKIIKV